ncbi:MAG: hypothetical protein KDB80_16645 [Planctomycetes bacterium]|nr:hypothetical protein [Planctomycetota bacterium]
MEPTTPQRGTTPSHDLDVRNDADYQARRAELDAIAAGFHPGRPIEPIGYHEAEQALWNDLCATLRTLHGHLAHPEIRHYARELGTGVDGLPPLAAVSAKLAADSSFRIEPVVGPPKPRALLTALSEGRLLVSLRLRHPTQLSEPDESDLVHALLGQGPALLHPELGDLYRRFGVAARNADRRGLLAIRRVFSCVLEHGAVEFDGTPRAIGATLLTSPGELRRFGSEPRTMPIDCEVMAELPCETTRSRDRWFVARDLESLRRDVEAWLARR